MSSSLKVDWCSYEAAKYAVMHWHYSKSMPMGKNNYFGAWEDRQFIGAVIFGTGASPFLGSPYGLEWNQVSELVRVALSSHQRPVSQIVTRATKMFKLKNEGLRLIVSFADPYQDHVGAIYQAMNWIYCGDSSPSTIYIHKGKVLHNRDFTSSAWWGYGTKERPKDAAKERRPGKHRYLYPLDRAMRRQILPLAQPYPKRAGG